MRIFKNTILSIVSLCLLHSCSSSNQVPNTLSSQEQNEGWELLFNGKNLDGWHLYNQGTNSAWFVMDGVIYCDPNNESNKADLVTNKQYENYDLRFEWKLEKEGNSGVFINVREDSTIAQTYFSGPEYQLLDDAHMDSDLPLKKSGCLYNFMPQMNIAHTKTREQWNNSRIVQKDGIVEFYLNGQQTAKMDFNSKEWHDMIARSNFKEHPHFGKYSKGHIALQDWSRGVSFRNMKIKEL